MAMEMKNYTNYINEKYLALVILYEDRELEILLVLAPTHNQTITEKVYLHKINQPLGNMTSERQITFTSDMNAR